jgi:cytochrome d ubiquinol oxidase subunit II
VRGLPVDVHGQMHAGITDVVNPYTLLGGLATGALFALHGAVFVALKSSGAVRADAFGFAGKLAVPATVLVAGFGVWTQLSHGKSWTWIVLAVAVVAQLAAVGKVLGGKGEGWAFVYTTIVVAAVVVLLFGALYPNLVPSTLNPDWSLTIHNGSSSPYTLKVMTWAALVFAPLVMLYQAWTYWVFRKRISADRIPEPIGLARRSD